MSVSKLGSFHFNYNKPYIVKFYQLLCLLNQHHRLTLYNIVLYYNRDYYSLQKPFLKHLPDPDRKKVFPPPCSHRSLILSLIKHMSHWIIKLFNMKSLSVDSEHIELKSCLLCFQLLSIAWQYSRDSTTSVIWIRESTLWLSQLRPPFPKRGESNPWTFI